MAKYKKKPFTPITVQIPAGAAVFADNQDGALFYGKLDSINPKFAKLKHDDLTRDTGREAAHAGKYLTFSLDCVFVRLDTLVYPDAKPLAPPAPRSASERFADYTDDLQRGFGIVRQALSRIEAIKATGRYAGNLGNAKESAKQALEDLNNTDVQGHIEAILTNAMAAGLFVPAHHAKA